MDFKFLILFHYRQSKGYGMFNMFKGLVGQKSITRENMQPILDKLKDHMIGELLLFKS